MAVAVAVRGVVMGQEQGTPPLLHEAVRASLLVLGLVSPSGSPREAVLVEQDSVPLLVGVVQEVLVFPLVSSSVLRRVPQHLSRTCE